MADLTPQERRFVRPYLAMKTPAGKGWLAGVVAGMLLCLLGILIGCTGLWPAARIFFLPTVVFGMVVIEISIDYRRKARLAAILQKYEAALSERAPRTE